MSGLKLVGALLGVETELVRKWGMEDAARLTGHWLGGASAQSGLRSDESGALDAPWLPAVTVQLMDHA